MENKILIGADVESPVYDLRDAQIRLGISGVVTSSLVGNELAIDQLRFRVNIKNIFRNVYETESTERKILADNSERIYVLNTIPEEAFDAINLIPYATPVWYYQDDVLVGKFYLESVDQASKTDFYLNCVSAIGILGKQKHLGGIYTGQYLPAVISEIIGGAFPFTVSAEASQIRVYNWLPIASKRDNLHQIVYAYGVNVLKRADGELYFDYLQQQTALPLPDDRVFLGGSARHTPPATRVEVTEHSFFQLPTDAEIVLFDNTDGSAPAGNSFVSFREAPVYGLVASSGLVIHESGVNYAIVSGVGVLTGKRYNHQTNRVSRNNPNATGIEKIADGGSQCTLISVINSSNVTRRLLSYYSSAQTVQADIIVNGEKPGDQLQFNNPFGRRVTAFLASMEFNVTSFERARCELVENYEPTPPGGGDYTHIAVLSASGAWTVPAGIDEITVVLIGGGKGGDGGYDGGAGTNGRNATASGGNSSSSSGGTGGAGGAAGSPGTGGRVFQARLDVTPGASFAVSIGPGGTGGARNGGAGADGGNTTFSGNGINYSSANGAVSQSGYYDVMQQQIYGASGSPGVNGGAGGAGGSMSDSSLYIGESGEGVGTKQGGTAGTTQSENHNSTAYEKPAQNSRTQFKLYQRYNIVSDAITDPEFIEETEDAGGGAISGPFYDYGEYLDPETYADYYWQLYEVNSGTGEWQTALSTGRITEPTAQRYIRVISQIKGRELRLLYYLVNNGYDTNTYIVKATYRSVTVRAGYSFTKGGSGGGGASADSNGGNATNTGGGAGGNASKPQPPSIPGYGGHGGNGGGGGGGGAGVQLLTQSSSPSVTINGLSGGAAGQGSAGGDGAPGCVLIYY